MTDLKERIERLSAEIQCIRCKGAAYVDPRQEKRDQMLAGAFDNLSSDEYTVLVHQEVDDVIKSLEDGNSSERSQIKKLGLIRKLYDFRRLNHPIHGDIHADLNRLDELEGDSLELLSECQRDCNQTANAQWATHSNAEFRKRVGTVLIPATVRDLRAEELGFGPDKKRKLDKINGSPQAVEKIWPEFERRLRGKNPEELSERQWIADNSLQPLVDDFRAELARAGVRNIEERVSSAIKTVRTAYGFGKTTLTKRIRTLVGRGLIPEYGYHAEPRKRVHDSPVSK